MEYPTQVFLSSRTSLSHRLGGWAGAGLMASTLLIMCPAAQADTLAAWQFDPASQQLTLTLPSGVTPQYTVERDPARVVLTIPQTQVGSVTTQQAYSGAVSGAVSQVSLSQVNADTVVVLELAPNTVLAAEGASLVAIAAGDQTRWVLTALVAPSAMPSVATAPGMIVELPMIPGNDPRLGFPEAGTGRLSTSAANLMLPSDINNLTNLPETLPVDPFNLGRPGEQVSVPSLAELDAAIGPVAIAPQLTAPSSEPPATAAQPAAVGTLPPAAPPAGTASVLTLEPPPLAAGITPSAPAAPVATIDAETSGIPIAVTPPELPAAERPPTTAQGQVPEAIAVEPLPVNAPAASGSAVIATNPPALPQPEVLAPGQPGIPNDIGPNAIGPNVIGPNVIGQEPPPVATVPVELNAPNLLAVPTAPNTTAQGNVLPPENTLELAAAGQIILFGTPLPNGGQAAYPDAITPPPAERPYSPDTLIAAGTVLELRYVGNEALNLNTSSSQNQVLLLAQDIRDPITNGVVAPAGSQLIGQFESTPHGQQWVSKMLIAPAGQQVAFSTISDYIIGTPEISPPRVAAGAGLGALALLLVTGLSGIGLIGGAIVGATTMVGTAPQHIVIEPNQMIQVQVMQDIPRASPIASAPENSREWGAGGW